MAQVEKASEPSMDEILASIRKIIAEEPAGAKTSQAGSPPMEPRRVPQPQAQPLQAQAQAPLAQPSAAPLQSTAAPSPFNTAKTVSAAPASFATSPPSVGPAPATSRLNEAPRAGKEDQNALNHLLLDEDLADLVDLSPSPGAAVAAPVARINPAPLPGGFGSPVNGLPTPPAPTPTAAEKWGWRSPRPAPKADVAPQRAMAPMAPQVVTSTSSLVTPLERTDDASLLAKSLAARVGGLPPPPSAAAPHGDVSLAAAKEAAIKAAARDAASKAAASALDALAAGLAAGSPVAPAVAEVRPAPVPPSIADAAPVAPSGHPITPAPVADLAAGEASISVAEPVIRASVEAVTLPVLGEAPADMPVASVPAAIAAPTEVAPVAAPPVAPMVTEAMVTSSPIASSAPIRTMEDTVAELLRPMLREWLDNNMPRIVEKAMRVEMASVVKPASPKS